MDKKDSSIEILRGNAFTDKILVFDCDGILLESVTLKMDAFKQWVPDTYKAYTEEFSAYNKSAFGKSRHVQIKYFYEELIGIPLSDEKWKAEVQRFTTINLSQIFNAKWVEGAKSFVEQSFHKHIPLFVLSGTPQKELEQILAHKQVSQYFKAIIGSPTTKEQGLLQICKMMKCNPTDLVFFGDATKDYEAATKVGTHFIYRPSEADFCGTNPDRIITNFLEI